MITKIYYQGEVVDCGDSRFVTRVSFRCNGADVNNLPKDTHPGADAYVIDWAELDSATRDAIGNQLLMFDGIRWVPQKIVYGT